MPTISTLLLLHTSFPNAALVNDAIHQTCLLERLTSPGVVKLGNDYRHRILAFDLDSVSNELSPPEIEEECFHERLGIMVDFLLRSGGTLGRLFIPAAAAAIRKLSHLNVVALSLPRCLRVGAIRHGK